jgi:hypothetical protein
MSAECYASGLMLDATLRMDEIRFDDAALIAKGSSVHGCAMNVRPNSVTLIFAVLLRLPWPQRKATPPCTHRGLSQLSVRAR